MESLYMMPSMRIAGISAAPPESSAHSAERTPIVSLPRGEKTGDPLIYIYIKGDPLIDRKNGSVCDIWEEHWEDWVGEREETKKSWRERRNQKIDLGDVWEEWGCDIKVVVSVCTTTLCKRLIVRMGV